MPNARPNTGFITDGANAFDPNLRTGYVESWTAGIQREIKKDNVIEVRYVGNRGHKLWRQVDLNELNMFENGALNEFRLRAPAATCLRDPASASDKNPEMRLGLRPVVSLSLSAPALSFGKKSPARFGRRRSLVSSYPRA